MIYTIHERRLYDPRKVSRGNRNPSTPLQNSGSDIAALDSETCRPNNRNHGFCHPRHEQASNKTTLISITDKVERTASEPPAGSDGAPTQRTAAVPDSAGCA